MIDTQMACQMFERLVDPLPPSVGVYCVVDEVSHFETWLWKCAADLETVAASGPFEWCMDPGKVAANVKVLMTSEDRSAPGGLIAKVIPATGRWI